jgi:hypothetical protein
VARLVYETTDADFADRAITAMRESDISCYRIGRGYSSSAAYTGKGFTEDQVCLYIGRDSDYTRANEILIQIGAVNDSVPRLPSKRVLFLLALLATALVAWVALGTK